MNSSLALRAATAFCLALGTLATSGPALSATGHEHFEVVNRYALGGSDKWDYLGYDTENRRLFISRATHVAVVDTKTGKLAGDIANTQGVHGFAFVKALNLGFVTNGLADTISVVDLKTLKVVDTIKAGGADPDAILYVGELNRLYTSNGHAQSVSAINVATRQVVATVPVGGKPESLVTDGDGRVFVAIEDKSEIVAIDGTTNQVDGHWPISDCVKPSGLAIDASSQRLFAVCANQKMVVVDAHSGREVASVPIGRHPDAAAFDPELKLVFSPNGDSGTLTVVHEDDPDHYTVLENVDTMNGAKTMALDEQSHRVYVASAKFASVPDNAPLGTHPSIVPDTFSVLVVQRHP